MCLESPTGCINDEEFFFQPIVLVFKQSFMFVQLATGEQTAGLSGNTTKISRKATCRP